jgi:toxin HigB-1
MIESFKNQAAEDIFNGINSKAARKACPQILWQVAARKLDQLDSVQSLEELKIPPGNQLENLFGNRKDEYSTRINEQYRICFILGNLGPCNVEITDYH